MPKIIRNDPDNVNKDETVDKGKSRIRTRSRSKVDVIATVAKSQSLQVITPKMIKKQKKVTKIVAENSAKTGPVKRLNFEGKKNNAKPATPSAKQCKKDKSPKVAKHDLKVIDDRKVIEDNVDAHDDDVYVHIDGGDSKFGSSESEYEDDDEGKSTSEEEQLGRESQSVDSACMMNDQNLKRYFNQLLDEKLANTKKELTEVRKELTLEKEKQRKSDKKGKQGMDNDKVKSPSDTMIYVAAFNKRNSNNFVPNGHVSMDDVRNKIANFVESIHLDNRRSAGASGEGSPVPITGEHITKEEQEILAEARKKVEHSVLDAEKHKAMVAEPPGEMLANLINQEQQGLVNSGNYGNILIPEQGQVRFHGKGHR